MRKFMGSLRAPSRRGSQSPVEVGSPSETITRDIKHFIDSKETLASGDEVLQLPKIVEAAEASPAAAAAAAKEIRKALSREKWFTPFKQYHAMMLLRILIDNPGSCKNLARNIDSKFRDNLQGVLKTHQDPSVQQITRETLDHFASERKEVPELRPIVDMWLKEKSSIESRRQSRRSQYQPANWQDWQGAARDFAPGPPPVHHDGRPKHSLPDQAELAGRIEEARTSAKLLIQLTQSTGPTEFNSNELIREFAERCQSAQRNLNGYMNSEPPPDEHTFQTLIETCEQLSLASSKHQRAALAARRQNKDILDRADNLYSGISRESSPNAAAGGLPPPRIAAPASSNQVNSFAPVSQYNPYRDESLTQKPAAPQNPFSDENQTTVQPSSSAWRQSSRVSPPTPQMPFAELPSNATPPMVATSFSPTTRNGETFTPPPGPPPRKPVPTIQEHENPCTELDALEERRPLTANSDDLYSHEPSATEASGYEYANGTAATSLPDRGKGRIKDDEPFSPVGGVSGSGWNY